MNSKQILVIDDDPVSTGILLAILGDEHRVVSANSGSAAIELLINMHPDLILLDINMPNINGYQVIKHLKGNPETADIPIVVISSLTEESDQEFGKRVGADSYLTKPISPSDIQCTIEKFLA
ncbi:response regulator [Shewanella gaetbuli]|uniref:Response regulator n=1 Tax=Shewanella gaetbuli TaxID=220752 RepID=A0A9X1ZTA6_9GAMM|nr:response regulator [Shewanella gaetbuli]MCL1143683.1 response regulator [Shewanella gaetbuli]